MKVFRGTSTARRAAAMLIVAALCVAAKPRPVDQEVVNNSAIIFGRIGVAKLALAYGLKGEAQANIKSAIDTANVLKSNASNFSLQDPLIVGRIMYRSESGKGESLVPLLNGSFSARVLDEKLLRSGSFQAEIMDASVMWVQVTVDGSTLQDDLNKAEMALKMSKTDDALAALNNITDTSLTLQPPAQGTLDLARDSLVLTQQLLKNRDFHAAGFAAGHAKEALNAASSSDAGLKAKQGDTDKALKGLDDLSETIRAGKLSAQKAPEGAASELIKELEGLAPKGN